MISKKPKSGAEREETKTAARVGRAAMDAAAYFVIFLVFVLVIGSFAAAAAAIRITHFPADGEESRVPSAMTYIIGSKTYRKVLTEKYFVDGVPYLNFSDVVTLCDLSVTGEKGNMTFITPGGETLTLVAGNHSVLVNGNVVTLDGQVLDRDGNLWVPLAFLRDYLVGVNITMDTNRDGKLVLSVVKNDEEAGFLLKSGATIEKIDLGDVPPDQKKQYSDTPIYSFKSDLSSFYPYMDPTDRDQYLKMSSPLTPTGKDNVPTDLVDVINKKSNLSGIQMRLCAEKSLEALFIEMYAAGFTDVTVRTGFRSYEKQQSLYNQYLKNEKYYYRDNYTTTGMMFSEKAYLALGAAYLQENYIDRGVFVLSDEDAARVTKTYTAFPGTSDHQTGLGCDMHNLSVGGPAFAQEAAYKWLCDNAYKFGFVERYPQGKEDVTGFAWEPHHWRFVGQYHAAKMRELGMCLEEYNAWLANNPA